MLQIGAASLLQTGASVVTNWGSYYKLGHNISAVLMKHRGKVKGEEVIILQMDQQLKTKNISDRDRLNVLMIKINFSLLKILTMNSLNVKHQGKSSNQLAFHLSAYTHL